MINILDESESNNPLFQQVSENIDINNLPGYSGETEYEKLKRFYDASVEEHNAAKQQISELNSSYFNLQKENESVTKNIDVHVNDVLSSFLTKNQIKFCVCVLNKYSLTRSTQYMYLDLKYSLVYQIFVVLGFPNKRLLFILF